MAAPSVIRALVYRELDGKSFVIQSDEPNVKVSWQVTGTRKDAYAEANRVVVEVDKTGGSTNQVASARLLTDS